MKFAFLLYDDEDRWDTLPDAEKEKVIGEHMAYSQSLRDAGAFLGGAPLDHSRNAKRARKGAIEDGPFTDSKEQMGGFYLIDAENLDKAMDWAARCPAASYGRVEVRPVWNLEG